MSEKIVALDVWSYEYGLVKGLRFYVAKYPQVDDSRSGVIGLAYQQAHDMDLTQASALLSRGKDQLFSVGYQTPTGVVYHSADAGQWGRKQRRYKSASLPLSQPNARLTQIVVHEADYDWDFGGTNSIASIELVYSNGRRFKNHFGIETSKKAHYINIP